MECVWRVTLPSTARLMCLVSINCTTQDVTDQLQAMGFPFTFELSKSSQWKTLEEVGGLSGGGRKT